MPVKSSRSLGRYMICFGALFILALLPRLYGAQTVGWDWGDPGFTLINFDEGGSCRAALGDMHPHLQLERAIDVHNFMPERGSLKWLYGTFQMFVGDIKIYRVIN